jgi:antitoxin component of MazEF toxin-antitoxin module
MRKRKIQKWSNSWIIKLEPADVKDFGFVEGDEVDIDELCLLRQEVPKKKKKEVIKNE